MNILSLAQLTACYCAIQAQLNEMTDKDEQTLDTTVVDGVTTEVIISNGNTVPILHPEFCDSEPMTRAALRTLRNSSGLTIGCSYTITDYNRGCLGAVEIILTATSVNEFAKEVAVNTADNEAWSGTYDIDGNRITSLEDNFDNYVRGANQVDAFPWANTRFRGNTVEENATLTVACDSTMNVWYNTFSGNSVTTLTDATGSIYRSNIDSQSQLNLTGATGVNIQGLNMQSRARILGNGSTTVTIFYTEMNSEGYWDFRNQTNIRSYYSSIHSTARIYYTGGERQWLYYVNINSYGFIRQFDGAMQLYYSTISSYAELRNEVGAALWRFYASSASGRAYLRNYNTNDFYNYALNANSSGRQTTRGATALRVHYTNITGIAQLLVDGTTTLVYGSNISSGAIFTVNGGDHYRNSFNSFSRVTTAFNTRNITTSGSFAQTLTAANTNTYRGYGQNNLI